MLFLFFSCLSLRTAVVVITAHTSDYLVRCYFSFSVDPEVPFLRCIVIQSVSLARFYRRAKFSTSTRNFTALDQSHLSHQPHLLQHTAAIFGGKALKLDCPTANDSQSFPLIPVGGGRWQPTPSLLLSRELFLPCADLWENCWFA